jgi:hypothetical protein
MDLLLRGWAVLLFVAGLPLFLGLGVVLGTTAFMGSPGKPDDFIPKFFQLYGAFAVAGLLTASGGVLWVMAKLAYPLKEK